MMSSCRCLSLALFVALALGLFACENSDVGVPCEIAGTTTGKTSGSGSSEPAGTQFNLQALDCQSRVCVQYGGGSNSKPRCTVPCKEDGDCPDGKIGSCQGGFVCRVGSVTGGVKCCKICVCKDDTSGNTDDQEASCRRSNISPQCPNI